MSDIAPVSRTLSQEQLHAYADAAGDHNPIHVDPDYARGTPFGGTIAHGMLVLAMIGEMMHDALGAAWIERATPSRPRRRLPTTTRGPCAAPTSAATC
jgi:acyl dehydratase